MRRPAFHLIALGCPKARVEAEASLAGLSERGLRWTDDPARADVVVVHTCGFITDAASESIDTLLELAALRRRGRPRLVAAGCLPQRAGTAFRDLLPEIDAVVGVHDLARLPDLVLGLCSPGADTPPVLLAQRPDPAERRPQHRLPSGPPHVRYLKIAEGCSRRCAFCTIPAIRGPARSRPAAALLEEARRLVDQGAVELVLVAQDVGRYGADRPGDRAGFPLVRLLERLARLPGLRWIRLLYLYPDVLSAPVLAALRQLPPLVPYFDLPFQHVADPVLRAMRRGTRRREIDAVLDRVRTAFPDATVRSTFLVGHPGEGEADFEALRAFVASGRIDRVGLFRFSAEEGTAAAARPDPVPPAVSWRRFRTLRSEARRAMRAAQRILRGRVMQVLVDGPAPETDLLRVGRIAGQAPEVDGITYLLNGDPPAGRFVAARIVRTSDADLVADLDLE